MITADDVKQIAEKIGKQPGERAKRALVMLEKNPSALALIAAQVSAAFIGRLADAPPQEAGAALKLLTEIRILQYVGIKPDEKMLHLEEGLVPGIKHGVFALPEAKAEPEPADAEAGPVEAAANETEPAPLPTLNPPSSFAP